MDQPAVPPVEELSLEKLSAAFASMLGTDEDRSSSTADATVADGTQPSDQSLNPTSSPTEFSITTDDDACPISPLTILEALLFVGDVANSGLSADRLAGVMRGVEVGEVHELVSELNRRYAANRSPYEIASEGAGYRLTLRPAFHRVRDKFYGRARQARLSQAAIDVLALVAYNEPLTGDEVNELRGLPSAAVLTQLVRRQLLRIEREETKPPMIRYFTTPRFLKLFGLESLHDLPKSQDLDPR